MNRKIGAAIRSTQDNPKPADEIFQAYRALFGSKSSNPDSEFLSDYTGPGARRIRSEIDKKRYGFNGTADTVTPTSDPKTFRILIESWTTRSTTQTPLNVTLGRENGKLIIVKDVRE